jgi:hypothetical protein
MLRRREEVLPGLGAASDPRVMEGTSVDPRGVERLDAVARLFFRRGGK